MVVEKEVHRERVIGALNAFRRILQAMRLASVEVHSRTGLSAAQLFVLHQLASGTALSINQLAQLTMTDRSSVAGVVDRLCERRLVTREWSAQDRRRAVVTITPAGRRALSRSPLPPAMVLVSAIERLPAAELKGLVIGLDRLTNELGIEKKKPVMLFEGDRPDGVRASRPKPRDDRKR